MSTPTAPSYLSAAWLARKLGSVNAVVTARSISIVFLVSMVLMPYFFLAALSYLASIVANTLSTPVRQSYVMGIVRPEERGTAAGLSSLPFQVAGSTTPTLAGYLMQTISINLPLVLGAFLQTVNVVLFYLFFHRIKPPEEMEALRWEEGGPGNPNRCS